MQTLNELAAEIYTTAEDKGFHPKDEEPDVAAWLANLHSEVSEAWECFRTNDMGTRIVDSKPEGFPSEMADVLIRCLDSMYALGIDINHIIEMKMNYNRTRSYRHGGKAA